jgi:hypothetical protein
MLWSGKGFFGSLEISSIRMSLIPGGGKSGVFFARSNSSICRSGYCSHSGSSQSCPVPESSRKSSIRIELVFIRTDIIVYSVHFVNGKRTERAWFYILNIVCYNNIIF